MDNLLKSVFDLPDVSFIDNDRLEAMMQRLVSNYEKSTGRSRESPSA